MDKSKEELFKLALTEGLSNRIDRQIAECTEEIVTSASHKRAMRKIVKGSSLCLKKIIAILVAAVLLLTGCAVVYREQIRSFIEEIYENFMTLKYSEGGDENKDIEEVYELTYLPEGYELKDTVISNAILRSIFVNENFTITLEQVTVDKAHSYLDIENGYTKVMEIKNWEIYHRNSPERNYYFWNVDDYYLRLICNFELPTEELQKIVDGAKIK